MAEDFVPLIQEIVDTHPGLGFLKEATEFHSRYVHTVSQHLHLLAKFGIGRGKLNCSSVSNGAC